MKKLSLLLAALLILSGTVVCAEWETFKSADGMYEYTKDGVITAYYGDEFAFFPAEIDGTKINEIGVMASSPFVAALKAVPNAAAIPIAAASSLFSALLLPKPNKPLSSS